MRLFPFPLTVVIFRHFRFSMPSSVKANASIFSYVRNINAAVNTVCVSFASNPLYRPFKPFCLEKITKFRVSIVGCNVAHNPKAYCV